ncbi:MAG: MFS transporter [Chloroflexota bacterium]|nr:MFS transporter [Chloroflexota bacterium]
MSNVAQSAPVRSNTERWISTPVGRGTVLLAITSFCVGFSMAAQQNIVSNYFEDDLGLQGPQFGYITAIREVPGFLLILLTALFYRLPLPRLTFGALLLLSVGYSLFGFSNSFWSVAPWVVLSSIGYHTWLQTQSALGLTLAREEHSGRILGRMAAISQGGALLAMAVVLITFQQGWLSFDSTFILCGAMALVAAIAIFRFPALRDGALQETVEHRDRIVFRRGYRRYYMLSLLDGARQQIFFSFGLWVLIDRYGLSVPEISAVLLMTTAASMILTPRIGRAIDAYGERALLFYVNIAFILALLGYALVTNSILATICYVAYTFIAPLAPLGATVYLRKIAPSADLAPSLAMGLTMQHAAAVVVPVVTGFILNYVGYQIPFLVASGFAVVNLFVSRGLNPTAQKTAAKRHEEACMLTSQDGTGVA